MTHAPNFDRPMMPAEEVRVFVADKNPDKIDIIKVNLGRLGLAKGLVSANNFEDAYDFINTQEPHNLSANVFLLSGGLDWGNQYDSSHGQRLAEQLIIRYVIPIKEVTDNAAEDLRKLGLSRRQQRTILGKDVPGAIFEVARKQLHAEALLVGTSDEAEGALTDLAQLPQVPYSQVAEKVYRTVVSKNLRT